MVPTRVSVRVTPVSLSANTNKLLVPANPNRKFLAVFVTGTGTVNLGFDAPAVVGTGITYGTGGQMVGRTWGPGDAIPTNAIYGISAAANSVVVEEGF